MRRKLLLSALAFATLAITPAADAITRKQLRSRSAEICRNADRAMQPADDKANGAAERGDRSTFVHYARKSIRIFDPYFDRLANLDPPPRGRTHYLNFIDHTEKLVYWLSAQVDAVDARRRRKVVVRRGRKAHRQRRLAKRAARNYPLRDACVKMLVAN